MKKHTQLLSALALSVGLTLSAPFPALASIPGQVPGQATLPSLAPMLDCRQRKSRGNRRPEPKSAGGV